jgi:hypothetical protein
VSTWNRSDRRTEAAAWRSAARWGWLVLAIGLGGTATPAMAQSADSTSAAGSIYDPPPPAPDEYRRTIQLAYREALKATQLDRATKQLLERAVHYQVWLLAAPEHASQRQKNIRAIISDLRNRSTSPAAREYLLSQVIYRCDQLLNEPRPDVRVAAVDLLGQLNSSWGPDIPCVEAADVLLRTLAFPDKYIHVKVVAAPALGRILRDSPANKLPILKRIEIAEKIAAEIKRLRDVRGTPEEPPGIGRSWAMWKLVEALGYCDRVYNAARIPVFADVLMETLTDPREDFLTRSRAAQALSRLPFEATSNLALLNYEVARLTHELGKSYNVSLAAGTVWPLWRRCAFHIYFAYETENAAVERPQMRGLMYQVNRAGLGGYRAAIQEARALVLPITNNLTGVVLNPPPVPAADLDRLAEWLKANQPPPDARLTPESRPPAAPSAPARTAPPTPMN